MALLPPADGAGAAEMGPVAFTSIRLLAGAIVLLPLLIRRSGSRPPEARPPRLGSAWPAALALAGYAITFSASYVTIPAGVGALILFGTVQILMLGVALVRGERLGPIQVGGFLAAIAGILVLVSPSKSDADSVDLVGALLMVAAGVGWGVYTLLGRGSKDPAAQTARNFTLAIPFGAALGAYAWLRSTAPMSPKGVALAVIAGAITSGGGYVLWYAALRGHTRTSAAAVQLLVPIIAALGGVLLLSEALTTRFALATVLVLGGVAAAVLRPAEK